MTEAVFLGLIALAGVAIDRLLNIALVALTLSHNPTKFSSKTKYGQLAVEFEHKVDE